MAAQTNTAKAVKKTAAKKADAATSADAAEQKPAAKATPAKKAAASVKKTAAAKPSEAITAAEVEEFTALINEELARVRQEYDDSMAILNELKTAGQDSAGDDPADAGAKTFEREQEMSIANNRLDLIAQMERALTRIKAGTYGVCESCGEMIPTARLQAFPQATLCVSCKAREERR